MIIDGVININKPEGLTSHDVVGRLRRRLHIKRIGHTGTLDPMATGVLPVCIGKATRAVEYYDADYKTYLAELRFGIVTDTLDITGEVLEENEVPADVYERLTEILENYRGIVTQVPPKYSALKVDGKRLYEYAREGLDVEIKSRQIYVRSIEVVAQNPEENSLSLEVCCSKGTYIRTICDDIGRDLGCGAVMTSLCRTASGSFSIDDAVDLDAVMDMSDEEIEALIRDVDDTLCGYAEIKLKPHRIKAFCNGMTTSSGQYVISREADFISDPRYATSERLRELAGMYKVYGGGEFLGIADINQDKELRPVKVIQCK